MTARVADIRDQWWAPKLGEPGEVVTNVDDINQCLAIIFTTPKGSDPHRPTFACDLDSLIDLPTPIVAARLPGVLIEAATLWEPRVEIIGVPVRIEGPQILYEGVWRPKGGGALQSVSGVFGGWR